MTEEMATELSTLAARNYGGNLFPLEEIEDKANLWLDAFRNKADDLMFTAMHLCLQTCKYPPTVADIQKAIGELLAVYKPKSNVLSLPPAPSGEMSPWVRKMVDYFKAGDLQAIAAEAPEMPISEEVISFARHKFSGISDKLIRQNYTELSIAVESNNKCFGCGHHFGNCATSGYYLKPVLLDNGWIKNEYARCGKGAMSSARKAN